MSWFHIDDDAAFHRKTLAAGNEAFGALTRMGAHSAKQNLDGFVDTMTAKTIAGKDAVIKRLVDVVFLHPVEGGFRIHDYHQYNPTAAEVAARKALRSQSGKQGGKASGRARQQAKAQAIGEALASAHALANDTAPASSSLEANVEANSNQNRTLLPSPDLNPIPLSLSFCENEASASIEPPKRRRTKPANIPPSNEPPAPGTPARRVFDAISQDTYLSQITTAPADFAKRVTEPAAYPGLNVVAIVLKALEWRSGKGARYSDGRAFLRGWLDREAKELAGKPKAAPTRGPAPPAPPEAFSEAAAAGHGIDVDPWAPKKASAS